MDISELARPTVSKSDLAASMVAKAVALERIRNAPLFQPHFLAEIQEHQGSFQRFIDSLNSQMRFIESIANSPFIETARQIAEAQERLLVLVESPLARLAAEMQERMDMVKAMSFPMTEFILRQSQLHQQILGVLHDVQFMEHFEPIVGVDGSGTLQEPLYVVDFPDPPENSPDESSIVRVTGFVGPEIVKFFHKYPDALKTIDRRKFEEFVAELFLGFGFEVELTARTRDGGKDIIAISRREVHVKHLIECKRPDPGNPVRVEQVRALLGVKVSDRATKAILATTTHFSADALRMFKEHEWELEPRDFGGLQDWIRCYLGLSTPR
jgi:hypothetical protein